jgi:uncharacterized membrane protein YhaH (DUF805 family)
MEPMDILFSLKGRINRAPYWMYHIIVGVAAWVVPVLAITTMPDAAGILFLMALLVQVWISLALGVKRAHDRGRSGFFLFLYLIPVVNLWPIIELAFVPGTNGENAYGPDPLG